MNMLKPLINTGTVLAAVASLTGPADAARLPVVPSPTNCDNPVVIQRANANKLSQPILVAERPGQEVARRDGNSPQPPNNPPIVPPSRSNDAKTIADLQRDINTNNSQLVQGLQNHNKSQNEALQKILNRPKE
jgi:hypothetical protein